MCSQIFPTSLLREYRAYQLHFPKTVRYLSLSLMSLTCSRFILKTFYLYHKQATYITQALNDTNITFILFNLLSVPHGLFYFSCVYILRPTSFCMIDATIFRFKPLCVYLNIDISLHQMIEHS